MSTAALQSFGFEDNLVRVMDRAGAPWFVGKDVCNCLEIANSRDAIGRLDEDEKDCVGITDAMSRERETAIVSESGVYALIFSSRKAAAKRFRKWVTSEVLPSLRRDGVYRMGEQLSARYDPVAIADLGPALAVIREARHLFGRRAARRMWPKLGLPDVSVDDEARFEVASGYQVPGSILGWLSECTQQMPEGRSFAAELYESYQNFCVDEKISPENQAKFGRALGRMGFTTKKANGGLIMRCGLQLIR